MAITLNGQTVPLPREFAPTLMKSAFEESVIGKLTTSEPMPLGEKVVPIYEGGFEVGYVAEATPKPVSDVTMNHKVIVPWKFAGIVLVSEEAARLNPAQMLTFMRNDMRNGISRQIDYGILYGKSARSGQPIPNVTFVDQTTNRVELDTAKDLVPQVLAGYDLAATGMSDPNGFAFDTKYRTKLSLASQQQLAPAGGTSPMPNLATAVNNVAGLPAAYGRTVAGRVGTQTDTGVAGYVGDWNKVRWGFASQIDIRRSTEATVVDGAGKEWHLFQDNMIAYLIEATIGWYVDPTAFAAFDNKVA